ncbi:glutamate-1-semialdehyde-2,1-aminomutase [Putridiphycobacter roseus]|uniref:Glutamate-1-semialdehyde 2,1-aminomutase n=1 Tax=Putridiphycobacter roseus TaxID=2219161 RepID=A0A2W1N393_9FLAO|nr:glutamate-1-semialdehyde 2,1-aminomutase [Putridiphycobacter roseus]PZE18787.1 glutamate-1-semialdehyde-2,1-aminomutase [Putridiphycobacter roseus]
MKTNQSKKLYKKGLKHLVGAVNSPVRAFSSVGGNPIFMESAHKSRIQDVDHNTYVDYVLSYGPMILGHGNKKVIKAVKTAVDKGFSFGASTAGEIELAKIVCDAFPEMDKVRFVNSGTEAVLSAIRLARAFTEKDEIIKFSGCYHGHSDALLVAAGSGLATLSMPGSKGVPKDAVKNTLIAKYNDLESVAQHLEESDNVAAIIIEPVAGNMGTVVPSKAFIKGLNKLARKYQVLIIADEVMAGFRSHFGGAYELLGLHADIICLGKVIGGGMPVGAYGAREEIMQMVAPLGGMYQAGTLSGNPIAMAAGIATLSELKKANPYEGFNETAAQIENMLLKAAKKHHVKVTVNRFGSMINAFFTEQTVVDFETAQSSNVKEFATFFWELLRQGVSIPPAQFEAWFLSTTLTKKDLKQTALAIDKAMEKVSEMKNN